MDSHNKFTILLTNFILITVLFCPIVTSFPEYNPSDSYPEPARYRRGPVTEKLSDAALIQLAERYMTSFDLTLAKQIKPYVQKLRAKERNQFLKDVEELNEAIENEVLSDLVTAKLDNSQTDMDLSRRYGEISRRAIKRIIEQYKKRPWMERLMDFAGNEIDASLQEI